MNRDFILPGGSKRIKFPVIRVSTVSTDGNLAKIKLEFYDENGNLSDSVLKDHPSSGTQAMFHFVAVKYVTPNWSVQPVSGYGVFEGILAGNTCEFNSSVPFLGKDWTYTSEVNFVLGNIDWSQYGVPKVVLK